MVNQGSLKGAAFLHHDHFNADYDGAGLRVGGQPLKRGRIGAQFGGALDAALGVAELGLGTEIGARGHARGNWHGESRSATYHSVIPGHAP